MPDRSPHRLRAIRSAIARSRRAAHRRRYRRRRAAAEACRSTSCWSRAISSALPERDRALVRHHRRDGAAPARHAAASARGPARKGPAAIGAAGRRHPADRRGANPVSRCAGPRLGRSVGAAGAGRHPRLALFAAWSTRCCASSHATARPALAAPRHRAARHAGLADAALDRALRRGHRARHRRGARARSRRSISRSRAMPRAWAETLARPRAATGTVRTVASGPIPQLAGYDEGAWWVQDAAAALAGAAARRCAGDARQIGRRPLRRARRQDRATGAAGAQVTAVDRSAPRLERLRQNLARLQLERRDRQGRRRGMAGRAVRRGAGRCALLIDRHDPAASRHPLAQVARPIWPSSRPCKPACSTAPRRCSSRAARWSIAPARWNPRRARTRSRPCSAAIPACAAARSRPTEVAGHAELLTPQGELRTLPCHWATTPSPGWAGSTASMRPEL